MPKQTNKLPKLNLARDERGSIAVPLPHPHLPDLHINLPRIWKNVSKKFKSITPEQYIISAALASQVFLLAYLVSFLIPKSVQFSYASNNCVRNNVLLPDLHVANSSAYQLQNTGGLRIGGLQLTSTATCLELNQVPVQGSQTLTQELAFASFIKQNVEIITPPLPEVAGVSNIELMPTNIPASFSLDQPDKTFSYKLLANKLTSECTVAGTDITCDIAPLKLKQSTKYNFKLERYFGAETAGLLIDKNISTVAAVTVKKASIKADQVLYDKPKGMKVEVSKEIAGFSDVQLKNLTTNELIPTTVTSKGKVLTVTFINDLPRQVDLQLNIGQITAPDKSSLAKSYSLKFKTSGGPKVAGVTVGNYGVYTNSNVTLTLDSSPATDQNLASYFSVLVSGKVIDSNVYQSGNVITIDPIANLPKCTSFTVRVLDGMKNTSGVTGGSAWSMNSRTICRSESVIGTSVLGRAIVAYRFGNGPSKEIFFGNMHGNEASAKYTLDSWINELEANYDKIPKNRTIIVIPTINPDGLVAGTRNNARNVDLNRNFPEANWKKNVQSPSGGVINGGGGSAPLSEPEASALANFILAESPRLVISYHAVGSVIISNAAGDANAIAAQYSANSGYWLPGGDEAEGVFSYEITGTLEGWLYESHNIPTLVIELPSYGANYFYSNQNALWAMVNLP